MAASTLQSSESEAMDARRRDMADPREDPAAKELTDEELEAQGGEALPDREAMSIINPDGGVINPLPPLPEGAA
jgi:hypothetical protein